MIVRRGPRLVPPMIEYGFERDTLSAREQAIRWWVFINVAGARNQQPRLGVVDRGFRFARGGRVSTEEEAHEALMEAREEAQRDLTLWRHQPSHALGPSGELIPLDEVLLEIGA